MSIFVHLCVYTTSTAYGLRYLRFHVHSKTCGGLPLVPSSWVAIQLSRYLIPGGAPFSPLP